MRTVDLVWHAVSLDLINLQSPGTKHKQRRLVGWFNSGAEPARKFRGGDFNNIRQSSLTAGSLL